MLQSASVSSSAEFDSSLLTTTTFSANSMPALSRSSKLQVVSTRLQQNNGSLHPPLSSSPKWSWERALGYSLAITVTPPGDTVERKSYSVRPVRFKRIENNDSGYAVGKHERKFRKRKTVTSKQIRYGKVLKNKLQDRIETSVGRCDE